LPVDENAIAARFKFLSPALDERMRRLVLGAEAMTIGRGGIIAAARATGVDRQTIAAGVEELEAALEGKDVATKRIRRSGGGRTKKVDKNPKLWTDLERLIEPITRGDPESPLRWTSKSTRRLAEELKNMGHDVSYRIVAELLVEHGYSLQANQKTTEGDSHPDRNEQFEHINAKAEEFLKAGEPVISVDTKKKELVGPFKNAGRELRPKGQPEEVMVHDFPLQDLGRVSPYGVYDLAKNEGWVSVGTDHDTASFAVASIRRWWYSMGQPNYPNAGRLLITADGGGSNGSRVRLWKLELQELADELALPIYVCHLPPGTSKWNKIEHRLFSHISQNWRGKPLVSHETIVQLIRSTTTKKGLRVRSSLDVGQYPVGRKVTDEEFAQINLHREEFHGDWNYVVRPNSS
jgi:hypothetical protein